MAGWNPNQGFSMPMFNPWVPEKVRPWIYLLFALFFQLSSGVYFGSLQQMVGATGFTREDMVMVAMFGVVGVNMPFPFLFRYKLRFTNQQLLINAACVIAVCNLLSLWLISSDFGEWRLPLLCTISYIAGYFKLCGTFECFSNIRLWLSPKQDFGIFLPSIYIVILTSMSLSNWVDQQLIMIYDSWQMMHWLIIGMMLVIVLVIYTCTHPWRMMPHQVPLISLDWLGCILVSACMLEVIWLFNYGEYYHWYDSTLWCAVLCMLPLTILITIGRLTHIRHPVSGAVDIPSLAVISYLGHVSCCRGDECYTASAAEHAHRRSSRLGIHHYVTVLAARDTGLCQWLCIYHLVGQRDAKMGATPPSGFQVHATAHRGFCLSARLSGIDVFLRLACAQSGTLVAAHLLAHIWLQHLLCHDDALPERPHRVSLLLSCTHHLRLHP